MCVEKSKVVIKEKKKQQTNGFILSLFCDFSWKLRSYIISMVLILKDRLLEIFLGWYFGEKKTCPPLKEESSFLSKSAIELAALIRTGEITSTKLIEHTINRMKEVNGILNAIVDGPFVEALKEAQHIDERIANKEILEDEFSAKPFLGVPFTTKDSTSVCGKLHTLGLLARKNTISKEDAECVALAKKAGAIILCTTNVPEVNKWQETRNNLIGTTNNTYDIRRTCGGSSGGEAALISSCASPFGIGTDIGGSIRMPGEMSLDVSILRQYLENVSSCSYLAFYCGIFGHKPTVGAINTRGCTFRTGKEASTMVVVGPMCRYAKDLLPLFKILIDPKMEPILKPNEKVDVRKLKYYYIRQSGEHKVTPVSNELQSAMTTCVNHIERIAETKPIEIKLHGTESATKLWRYWMTQEPADFNIMLGNGKRLNPYVELVKKLILKSDFTMAAIYSLIDEILPKEKGDKIKEITRKCDEELTNILGDDGILFYHSMTRTAPFHGALLLNVSDFSYWSIFNVLHVPATQVPLGLDKKGLPLGIQVVATRNRDRHCLAVAEELETAFGGWNPPF